MVPIERWMRRDLKAFALDVLLDLQARTRRAHPRGRAPVLAGDRRSVRRHGVTVAFFRGLAQVHGSGAAEAPKS